MKKFLCIAGMAMAFICGCSKKQAAIVNGFVIYESDVTDSVKEINKETIDRFGKENINQNVLDGLIEKQLVMSKIREEKYDNNDKIQDLWKKYTRTLSLKYFLNNYMPENHPVSKKVLQKEYDAKKEYFKTEGQVHARHILIRTDNGKHSDKEALDKITSIQKELKKDGSNFAETAQKYSECTSAKSGGDLNYVSRGQMVKPFEEAVFALKKGTLTDKPVKTEYGYHLIFAEDVKDTVYTPLDEVKQYFLPEIYMNDMIKEYNLVVNPGSGKAADDVVGEIKKTGLKFTRKAFMDELEATMGKAGASSYITNNKDISKGVKEILVEKIFEDKIKKYDMEEDAKYKKFMQKTHDDLLVSTYLEDVFFKGVTVSDTEVRQAYKSNYPMEALVQQFGDKFKNDASYRKKLENEMIFPDIKQKLMDQKKNTLYYSMIGELKKKYSVEYKKKYKTT